MALFHAVVWTDHQSAQVLQFDAEHLQTEKIRAHTHEELGGALDGERGVAGPEERGGESIPHEGGIVSDDDGLGGDRGAGHRS